MEIISIANLAITALGVFHSLRKSHKDLQNWEESDLEVEFPWLDVALEKGFLDGEKSDYAWPLDRSVNMLELKGTHQTVLAINENKRSRHRLVVGPPSKRHVLVRKSPKNSNN